MQLFNNIKIDWLGKRKIFYLVSTVLFLIGVLNVIFKGFHFGIDFKGGTEIVLQYDKPIEISQIRQLVENVDLGNLEVKTFGGETGVLLRTDFQNLPARIFPIVVANIEKQIDLFYPGLPRKIVDSTVSSITYELPNHDTTTALISKLFNAGFQAGKVSESLDNKQMVVNVSISEWLKENLRGKIAG
ncbi:MAG: protein translocase subunit SecF, partial [Bacteroidetes bacterium]|nr:protein translocase subunit SecF [Bacteroidota bacterium]